MSPGLATVSFILKPYCLAPPPSKRFLDVQTHMLCVGGEGICTHVQMCVHMYASIYICMCLVNQSKSETQATPSDLPKCLREGRGQVKGIMKFPSCSVRGLATSLRTPVWFCTFLLTALALFVLAEHSWGNGTSSKMECSSYPEGPSLPSSCLYKSCP